MNSLDLFRLIVSLAILLTLPLGASGPPEGFRVDTVAFTHGFLTSLTVHSDGTVYYTNRQGEIRKLTHGVSDELVARVETENTGNAALLGMSFGPADEMVVHYVEPGLQADIVSAIDRETHEETVLARIPCTPTLHCSSEHRGGNPVVTSEGVIYVGIGDYGVQSLAQKDGSNAGKIHRIAPDGEHSIFANGLRNPFDVAWDSINERLVISDNGPIGQDEINLAHTGDNLGWPLTMGNGQHIEGSLKPSWVFEETIAPTGLTLAGTDVPHFAGGILLTAFVSKTLYFFPTRGSEEGELTEPVVILAGDYGGLIDVALGPDRELYFASTGAIYRLISPRIGDVDGDGFVSHKDYYALVVELEDGDGSSVFDVGEGGYPATWGADLNGDRVIDRLDLEQLASELFGRRRSARR